MSLSTTQRLILLTFCGSLAALVPFLTLVVLATQEPAVLARELLSDADCTRCLDVRRRADFLVNELPVLSSSSPPSHQLPDDHGDLLLDCAAKGGSSKLRMLRTLCEKGSRVSVADAANLLLRSVCEAGSGFKACSAVMNQHREAILEHLSAGLVSASSSKRMRQQGQQQPQQSFVNEASHFCWPMCEGKLKYLDRIALLLVQWATQPEVYRLITAIRDVWGALAILGLTACLLGTAIQLRVSSSARTTKLRVIVQSNNAPAADVGSVVKDRRGGTAVVPTGPAPRQRR